MLTYEGSDTETETKRLSITYLEKLSTKYLRIRPKKKYFCSGFPTDPYLKARPYLFYILLSYLKKEKEMFTYNKKMRPYGLESPKKKLAQK